MLTENVETFRKRFGKPEFTVVSPGRVNIIGEHTDYNGGRVLPFAISKTLIITGKTSDGPSQIYSELYKEAVTLESDNASTWVEYLVSAQNVLKKNGHVIKNVAVSIGGNLDPGAGMSSSSALTCGFLQLLNSIFELEIDDDTLIKYASIAENSTGVLGGIMDQSCILKAEKGKALLLDCQSNESKHIPISLEEHEWLLVNSGVSHKLSDSGYNNRASESQMALSKLKNESGLNHLRNATKEHLDYLRMTDSTLAKRVRHFFMEEKRVSHMLSALEKKNAQKTGEILNACHYSLSHLYEVSCSEVDYLVGQLQSSPEVEGARMIGGGFGGSVLCLIKKDTSDNFIHSIIRSYFDKFKLELSYQTVTPQDGLKIIDHAL